MNKLGYNKVCLSQELENNIYFDSLEDFCDSLSGDKNVTYFGDYI